MRFGHTLVLATALGAAVGLVSAPAGAQDEERKPRVGVFFHAESSDLEEAYAGIREGFRIASMEPAFLERSADGDEAKARAALGEFEIEGVHLVFAVGDRAAVLARDTVRYRPVVYTAVTDPVALGLTEGSNACGTAGGVPARKVLDTVRLVVPKLESLAVVVPDGDVSARAAADALETAAGAERAARTTASVLRVPMDGATADERARTAVDRLVPATDAVFVPPSVPAADAAALAQALAGSGKLLVGSRKSHLDAGCALVVRADERRLGALAVVHARRILAGAAPSELAVRRPSRYRLEANLNAAARLRVEIPLPVLAASDRLVPRFVRRPR